MSGAPRQVAIVGAGSIGAGWAALFAMHGARVRVADPDPAATERAAAALEVALSLGERRVAGQIDGASLEDAVGDADWVQESVPEDADLKRRLLRHIEEAATPDAVIASSTSSFRRADLNGGLRDPSRLLIVHPLHPVYVMPIVEVSGDERLPAQTMARVLAMLRALGREPIVVRGDLPGLIANRLTAAILREALDLIIRGATAPAELDRLIARGISAGWAARGLLGTEVASAGESGLAALESVIQRPLAPLWSILARWPALEESQRRELRRALEDSSGDEMTTAHAGEQAWAETLSRVLRAAEETG